MGLEQIGDALALIHEATKDLPQAIARATLMLALQALDEADERPAGEQTPRLVNKRPENARNGTTADLMLERLERGPATVAELAESMGRHKVTVNKVARELCAEKKIERAGLHLRLT